MQGVGASQVALVVKNSPASAGDIKDMGLTGKILWRRAWQPSPVFLLGESHGERSLMGYSPWGCKESDMNEWLSTAAHIVIWLCLYRLWASLVPQMVKNLKQCRSGFDLWVRKILWRREWLPAPVFLPGEFPGQRSLVDCSPRGHRVGCNWVTNTQYTLPIKETILNFYRLGWLTWQITTMKKFTPWSYHDDYWNNQGNNYKRVLQRRA